MFFFGIPAFFNDLLKGDRQFQCNAEAINTAENKKQRIDNMQAETLGIKTDKLKKKWLF